MVPVESSEFNESNTNSGKHEYYSCSRTTMYVSALFIVIVTIVISPGELRNEGKILNSSFSRKTVLSNFLQFYRSKSELPLAAFVGPNYLMK